MGYNLTQINPAYELVSDIVVGTATTSVDITGLNIGKEDDYMLVSDFVNALGTSQFLNLTVNGNNTLTNYYVQQLQVNSTSIAGGRANTQFYASANANQKTMAITNIKLTNNGYFVCQSNVDNSYGTSSLYIDKFYTTSIFTATSITSLRISSTTNAIGAGSRFQLYKRKAPIIADIIVSTATTSVDITGLSIDKGSEYMLVGTLVAHSSGGENFPIYCDQNGTLNTTLTNYYSQVLQASSTTVVGARINAPYIVDLNASQNGFVIVNLKLTNNGYFVVQSNGTQLIGGSSILIRNQYNTSTFTTNSITTLRIGNGNVGVGSRFQLIKLK